eukprot:TRINITY_DN681_c0_g2_i3.p1 TRINITY_DN681_c0_g2~~TRINITY_DN681_c0_g2_i3.p1  ORF type:complete len:289 (+),score=74.08 TRINITY_DN681_c0_g2_i3:784-1650(+)
MNPFHRPLAPLFTDKGIEAALAKQREVLQTAHCKQSEAAEAQYARKVARLRKKHSEELQREIHEREKSYDLLKQEMTSQLKSLLDAKSKLDSTLTTRINLLTDELEDAKKKETKMSRNHSHQISQLMEEIDEHKRLIALWEMGDKLKEERSKLPSVAKLTKERAEETENVDLKMRLAENAVEDARAQAASATKAAAKKLQKLKEKHAREIAELERESNKFKSSLKSAQQQLADSEKSRAKIKRDLSITKNKLMEKTDELNELRKSGRGSPLQQNGANGKSSKKKKKKK